MARGQPAGDGAVMANRYYQPDNQTLKERLNFVRDHSCAECGEALTKWWDSEAKKTYIACHRHDRNKHEGVGKQYIPPDNINNLIRRERMEQQHGVEKIKALTKYEGVVSLNRSMALEILEALWPEAPLAEKGRAALLCASQQLNPLMKHVFLVPFNKGKPNESWTTVIGINAKRLMASRRGTFSYVDDTPRVMTDEEQKRRFGKVKEGKLVTIVKLRDPQTGAEAVGYGDWNLKKRQWDYDKKQYVESDNDPYGTDKGNDMFNMASIHAESQALNRLRPGDMPQGVMVMEESLAEAASREGLNKDAIEGDFTETIEPEKTGNEEPKQNKKPEKSTGDQDFKDLPGANKEKPAAVVSETKPENAPEGKGEASNGKEVAVVIHNIDVTAFETLLEQAGFKNPRTWKSWLTQKYKITIPAEQKLTEVLLSLSAERAKEFYDFVELKARG